MGVSVEDQTRADERIPELLATPAAVRFVSAEPLLSPVDLEGYLCNLECGSRLDWVIVGGESGHGARPMRPEWARSLLDQCRAAGVAAFFKQAGSRREGWPAGVVGKGDDPRQWPEWCQMQEFPRGLVHA
jgi:protein gp37